MGEIKSVKVDNWGVFFLQKLQNFFNKTDYCDLTLQFRDNSQLKVHRLVLSACTDYFNVLEQTCEMVDDALLMPDELQADVVVPIVNFMYTGTLEFELKMYGKLLRTAKEMNMTVLLKLLEAHRRTMEGVNRAQRLPSPKPIRRRLIPVTTQQQTTGMPGRRILASSNVSPQQSTTRVVQTKNIATNAPQAQVQYRQQIGNTSLLRTTGTSPVKVQYGTTTIFSRSQQQVKQEVDDYETSIKQQSNSPFEQLRKGYNNNKRPSTTNITSPVTKKPNIEDVKEFAEQQRMRKQIAAEYGDDQDYEGMLDDDIHNDDDDDDAAMTGATSTGSTTTNAVAVQANTTGMAGTSRTVQQGTTTITFRHEQNDKPPTIVVKDSSNSNINHKKIITEVLRQYPHLVKNNKNIKLKIMPSVDGQAQKIIVKREPLESEASSSNSNTQSRQQQQPQVTITKSPVAIPQKPANAKTPQSVMTSASESAVSANAAGGGATVQKRRIDSKTMHALIAQGAENTTGPWLCLRCGVNGRPISIPSYRGFRRHLINTHKESIDAALCEHCGWRSSSNRELHYHIQVEHKIKTTLYTFPECLMCAEVFLDTNSLNQHMVDSHPDENKQQCIYCNKIFAKEIQLYNHMKTYHKKQALEDGIIDYSDEEFMGSQDESEITEKKDTKVKILSDISLPNTGSLLKLEPSSEAAALSTVASGIATSIGIASTNAEEYLEASCAEPKFVNAEGNEMILTDEQRKEIMSQLNQEHEGGAGSVVMVLSEPGYSGEAANESNNAVEEAEDNSKDMEETEEEETIEQLSHEADQTPGETSAAEDAAMMMLYGDSELSPQRESSKEATESRNSKKNVALNESKESIENLEWAENLISAHELSDDVSTESSKILTKATSAVEDKAKKEDDISKKLKELTGDWSDDDENDEEDHDENATAPADNNTDGKPDDLVAKISTPTEEKPAESNSSKEAKSTQESEAEFLGDESKYEEDDIDLAMRSLHKEDGDMDDTSTSNTKEQRDDIADELKEIDKIEKTNASQKSSASEQELSADEITKDTTSEVNAEDVAKDDDIKMEENANKSLLDELISDADISGEIHEEDEKTSEEVEKEAEKEHENEITTEQDVKDETELNEKENNDSVHDDVNIDKKDESATLEPMEVDAEPETETDVCTSKSDPVESETAEDEVATTEAESESVLKQKTEDNVKSLISDWGDDDDDDNGEEHGGIAEADVPAVTEESIDKTVEEKEGDQEEQK